MALVCVGLVCIGLVCGIDGVTLMRWHLAGGIDGYGIGGVVMVGSMCVCVCACVRACVRACVHVCVSLVCVSKVGWH